MKCMAFKKNFKTSILMKVMTLSWGSYFSTKKVYKKLIGQHETLEEILNIWKSCNLPRLQLFAKLLLK
jgi:hypothetical protein